ncbi:hypothetical protein CDD83_9998 [Cordyceps sp. RAO-2017]|nr:hypothetical protein CDD83_9998 [Cordyceps sp. RAO-2017]
MTDLVSSPEQEVVIARLAGENAARNESYRRLLLALPAVAAAAHVPLLLRARTAPMAVVGLSSLAATAFLLRRLPPHRTGIARLDAWAARSRRPAAAAAAAVPSLALTSSSSPLESYLPYLNLALAAVLVLMGWAAGRAAGDGSFRWLGIGTLPALVYGAVLAAKVVMAGVDPEQELSGLRYGYRGA